MKRSIIVIGLMTLGLTAAIAQSNVVEQRQDLMKQFGAQSKTIAGMLRGQTPFDLAQAQAALKTVSETAKKLPPLVPESTKAAPKTEALPTVWENKAEFEKLFASLDAASQKALASVTDEASFKAQVPNVLQNCGTCHKTYRKS
jgi:cytochrome c556